MPAIREIRGDKEMPTREVIAINIGRNCNKTGFDISLNCEQL
jgi:hypothetical protein